MDGDLIMTPPRKSVMDGTLACSKCLEIKSIENFSKKSSNTFGYHSWCHDCRRTYHRVYQSGLPRHPNRRVWEWKKRGIIGMTMERYEEMLEIQGRCCAICNRHEEELDRTLCVDHNHATGEVRGLLCRSCNVAIGLLREDTAIFRKATEYVEFHNMKVEA